MLIRKQSEHTLLEKQGGLHPTNQLSFSYVQDMLTIE
jgi:hypothetical protein